jgi:hypothetical protein
VSACVENSKARPTGVGSYESVRTGGGKRGLLVRLGGKSVQTPKASNADEEVRKKLVCQEMWKKMGMMIMGRWAV